MVPVISFIGRHNSGKTTVLSGVIQYLKQAGYKVAVIKHAHHSLDISVHKDSELFLRAGADYVCASSPGLMLKYQRRKNEADINSLLSEVPAGFDLIIVEGYKNEALLKIEVLRENIDPEPMLLPQTIALVSDFPLPAEINVFPHQAIEDIAQFLLAALNINRQSDRNTP
ncbi:MAG: molybdopterin-guanine dinucleotide biosynthesis protein B [Syntrophomonadaceae bacterium]|nr:molybdopterin-guanine dinucleotide biosynthesis protein B [Syntrophomonadaceae bacterium]